MSNEVSNIAYRGTMVDLSGSYASLVKAEMLNLEKLLQPVGALDSEPKVIIAEMR